MVNIFNAPMVVMDKLESLFIEMTAKNCNQRCKHCYIDFPINKNVKDFISIEKIKAALQDTKNDKIECIYLTGAEPMTHPDFNSILRLCLKRTNVCICTNASFINEKKSRFLKKVEDETENEIIFKLSIDHYNELKNDELRGRGAFRQTISAIKSLIKYDFNPILQIVNYYHEDPKIIITEFKSIFDKIGFETSDINYQIKEYHNKYAAETLVPEAQGCNYDCKTGRILTEKGVYVCPFLANDHRGWSGNDFSNYSKKMCLETSFCTTCISNKKEMFTLNYKKLNS